MSEFIARRIMEAREKSLEAGQAKYRTYFITLKRLYGKYKEATDAILILEDCSDCIVTE